MFKLTEYQHARSNIELVYLQSLFMYKQEFSLWINRFCFSMKSLKITNWTVWTDFVIVCIFLAFSIFFCIHYNFMCTHFCMHDIIYFKFYSNQYMHSQDVMFALTYIVIKVIKDKFNNPLNKEEKLFSLWWWSKTLFCLINS